MNWITLHVRSRIRTTKGGINSEVRTLVLRTDLISKVITEMPPEQPEIEAIFGQTREKPLGSVVYYNDGTYTVLESTEEIVARLTHLGRMQ